MSLALSLARVSDIFRTVPLANRNLVVDPAFDVWSAASAALGTTYNYTPAVMYVASAGAGGAGTVQQIDLQTPTYQYLNAYAASGPRLAYVHAQTVASTGNLGAYTTPAFIHSVEGVRKGAGRSITMSYTLWTGSGTLTIPQVRCIQNFGTGGSPSAAVILDKAVNWVVTTTPTRFSVRIDLPSVAGKTVGTDGNNLLSIGFYMPPGVTFSLGIMECQAEICSPNSSSDLNGAGGAPTVFEYRGNAAELIRTQRYYEAGSISSTYINSAGAIAFMTPVYFKAVKRINPAMTWSNILYYSSGTPTAPGGGSILTVGNTTEVTSLYLNPVTNAQGLSSGNYVADARP